MKVRLPFPSFRRRLDETLFQDPPSPVRDRLPLPAWTLVVGLFALAIVLQMERMGFNISLHSFWAEDGAVFLSGAVHHGFGGSLFDPYATYLVFVPRVIGELAWLAPIEDAPIVVSVLSGAVVALSGWIVWEATGALIESLWLRGALVLLTVLSPYGGLESTATGAYVPWYMLFATFWILLWRPRRDLTAGGAGLFALLTGLSSPGVWFFIPLALLRTLVVRDRRDGLLLAGYWVGAAAQVPVLAFNDEPSVTPVWTHDIWTAYIQRVADGAFLGLNLGGRIWQHFGWSALLVLLAVAVAALLYGLARTNLTARLFALLAIPISLLMFVISVYQRAVGAEMVWQPHSWTESAGRYAIVPAMLLLSVAAVMFDRRSRRRPTERRPRWIPYALAALAIVVVAFSYRVEDPAVRGAPPWQASLDHSAEVCEAQPAGTETAVLTSPPGWGLNIPCGDLAKFGKGTAPAG